MVWLLFSGVCSEGEKIPRSREGPGAGSRKDRLITPGKDGVLFSGDSYENTIFILNGDTDKWHGRLLRRLPGKVFSLARKDSIYHPHPDPLPSKGEGTMVSLAKIDNTRNDGEDKVIIKC